MDPGPSRFHGSQWGKPNATSHFNRVPESQSATHHTGISQFGSIVTYSTKPEARSTAAAGGSVFMVDYDFDITAPTLVSTTPPRQDSIPVPTSQPRKTRSWSFTSNPRTDESSSPSSNSIATSASSSFCSIPNKGKSKSVNPAESKGQSEVGSTARATEQILNDAAYAEQLCLEELMALDASFKSFGAGFLSEEQDVGGDDMKITLGDRDTALREFLELQENVLDSFRGGAGTYKDISDSDVTPLLETPPLNDQDHRHDEESVQTLDMMQIAPTSSMENQAGPTREPGSSRPPPSELEAFQDTSPADATSGDAVSMIAADLNLSPFEAATGLQAKAKEAGKKINIMDERLYKLELKLAEWDQETTSPGHFLVPQLRSLRKDYNDTKMASVDLALAICNFAHRFHNIIIPRCIDDEVSLGERNMASEDCIKQTCNFATASKCIATQWTQIRQQILQLEESCSEWEMELERQKREDLGHLEQLERDLTPQIKANARSAKALEIGLTGVTITAMAVGSVGLYKFIEAPEAITQLLRREIKRIHSLLEYVKPSMGEYVVSIIDNGVKKVQEVQHNAQGTRHIQQVLGAEITQTRNQIQKIEERRNQLRETVSCEASSLSEVYELCMEVWTRTRNDAVGLNYIHIPIYLQQYANAIQIG